MEHTGKLKAAVGTSWQPNGGTSCKLMSEVPAQGLCFQQILTHLTYLCNGLTALTMISIGSKCFQQNVGYQMQKDIGFKNYLIPLFQARLGF